MGFGSFAPSPLRSPTFGRRADGGVLEIGNTLPRSIFCGEKCYTLFTILFILDDFYILGTFYRHTSFSER